MVVDMVELKCVLMRSGTQYAVITGIMKMLPLPVAS